MLTSPLSSTFDELDVVKNGCDIGGDEIRKEVCLQLSDLNLEVVLLAYELFFGLLKLGLLNTDNHRKQLVFEATLCDNEVDNGALGSSLRLIVGVVELRLQV